MFLNPSASINPILANIIPNGLITQISTIYVDGNIIISSVSGSTIKWYIAPNYHEVPSPISLPVTSASEGKYRTDLIFANKNNEISTLNGIEASSATTEPTTPEDTISVATISVFGAAITPNIQTPANPVDSVISGLFYSPLTTSPLLNATGVSKTPTITTVQQSAVDYLQVVRDGTNQANLSNGTDIIFNKVVDGNIAYDPSTGVATLVAGRTYAVRVNLAAAMSASYAIQFAIVDAVTNTALSKNGEMQSENADTNNSTSPYTEHLIYTGSTDRKVKVRIVSSGAGGGESIAASKYNGMVITQVGTSKQIYSWTKTQVQIREFATGTVILDSDDVDSLSYVVPNGVLDGLTKYQIRSRHKMVEGIYTPWSQWDNTFTTV